VAVGPSRGSGEADVTDHPDPDATCRPDADAVWFDGRLADRMVDSSDDPADLDRGGWWAVVVTFEGAVRMWRFDRVRRCGLSGGDRSWAGPAPGSWRTSLDESAYRCGVREIRRRIHTGEVYQANLCRVMSAPVRPGADPWALAARLIERNPSPYPAVLDIADSERFGPGIRVVSASPELFLGRAGDVVRTGPIKGTARTAEGLSDKDVAENVMIVDLARNDLQRVCRPGEVSVPDLLRVEEHPGLVHLVSVVEGRLRARVGWSELLAAMMPPASVSGAPKHTAMRAITDLERGGRGPYCGAVGWVDADRAEAVLAVGIRTFWWDEGRLNFGTGAGITWGSDPDREWAETELKAARLVGIAEGR
jgi:para-aminobenzoate synthetase component 1